MTQSEILVKRGFYDQPTTYDREGEVWNAAAWRGAALAEVSQILSKSGGFPCYFARTAFEKEQLFFMFSDNPFCPEQRKRVREALQNYLKLMETFSATEKAMRPILIIYRPLKEILSVDGYHQQAWMVMQDWVDHDPAPWPADIPKGPGQKMWSLCFAGTPIFVNVSSPAHIQRKSRNMGQSLVLVVQPRAGFDLVAGDTPAGDKVRQRIRDDQGVFDGIPAPEQLGSYHKGDLEWPQYAVSDQNKPDLDRCPIYTELRSSD